MGQNLKYYAAFFVGVAMTISSVVVISNVGHAKADTTGQAFNETWTATEVIGDVVGYDGSSARQIVTHRANINTSDGIAPGWRVDGSTGSNTGTLDINIPGTVTAWNVTGTIQ